MTQWEQVHGDLRVDEQKGFPAHIPACSCHLQAEVALITGIKVTHNGFLNGTHCSVGFRVLLDVHKSVSVLAEGSEHRQSCFKRLQFYFLFLDLLWSWMQMMA